MPRIASVALLALLSACARVPLDEDQVDGLRHLTGVIETNGRGEGRLVVPVEEGETSMLVTAAVHDPWRNHVRSLEAPGKAQVFDAFALYDTARNKTNAGFVAPVSSLNWPVQPGDRPLEAGAWQLEFGTLDGQDRWDAAELAVDVLLKRDEDPTWGRLHASVVLTGELATDPEMLRAIHVAADHWAAIYAAFGIELEWELFEYPRGELYAPSLGSAEHYEAISSSTPLRSVNVVIAEQITGFDDIYGMSGDIPGPLVSSGRSAVILSSLVAAGPDGAFSRQEERLFGETLAHEVGHYLGLFHPVEIDFAAWDALQDTPECHDERECVNRLAGNLMFPYPVCDFHGCVPQDLLTLDQQAVTHAHVAVD